MSRIIVKNLPKKVNHDSLKETFGSQGFITDLQLKYTKDGKFRGFAFVGYKTEEEADAAIKFFNNTFIGATKVVVEKCAALGSSEKPRGWSKYAPDSSAYARAHKKETVKDEDNVGESSDKKEKSKKKKKDGSKSKFEEVQDEPEFREFLAVHQRGGGACWADGPAVVQSEAAPAPAPAGSDQQQDQAEQQESSDMAFLKSKVVHQQSDSDSGDSGGEADKKPSKKPLSDDKRNSTPRAVSKFEIAYTVKISGLPARAKKKDVRQFLAPLKPKSLRLPPKCSGIAFIGLQTEKELKQALNKNRTFLNGRRVDVRRLEARQQQQQQPADQQDQQQRFLSAEAEPVGETGRIYVRNLACTVTEPDLEQLFSKYGQLTEVTLPVDRYTRKVKGFGFVTFMFPENAERAFGELDGSVLQGRMLHLLPAKLRRSLEEDGDTDGSANYKERKEKERKKQAGSSHNWNSLFLGASAVADLMAERYDTTKKDVLSSDGSQSAAVRLALGETQLVSETREFLEEQGVRLDAFSQPAVSRSNTVMLAKNLPAHTDPALLRDLFQRHGQLGRLILPPSGVTAVIEFLEPSEARTAFRSLAYTKFKNGPLYLEWAPTDALKEPSEMKQEEETNHVEEGEEDEGKRKKKKKKDGGAAAGAEGTGEPAETEDLQAEEGATLFVKNISFSTTDEALREHFSQCGTVVSAAVARRRDASRPSGQQLLSQGYGFVSYLRRREAKQAIKQLQQSSLDQHALELKISNRTTAPEPKTPRKKQELKEQKSSKILVRNIPFQANRQEITDLFKTFGELAAVRLPQKMSGIGTGNHRGFAFVEFTNRKDAKRAFSALCTSTHLYGRRLVLEWAAAEDDVDTIRKKTAAKFMDQAPSKKRVKMDDETEA